MSHHHLAQLLVLGVVVVAGSVYVSRMAHLRRAQLLHQVGHIRQLHDEAAANLDASLRDPLTGLWNRRAFESDLESLERARGTLAGTAVIVADLDDLKQVNDRHGHAAGDAFLRAVAAGLVGSLRADDAVYRIAGDEFAAILSSSEGADPVRRLGTRLAVEIPGVGAGSASLGIATARSGEDRDAFLRRADGLLYEAKRGNAASA